MLIGIDVSRANKEFKTGTEWYSYYLVVNFIKIDNQNKYILYSDKPLSEYFLNHLNLENNTNVKIKILWWPFRFFWTLGRFSLEMLFFRPDVLFVPAHTIPFFFTKKKKKKKTITTIHDIAFKRDERLYDSNVFLQEYEKLNNLLYFFVKIFLKKIPNKTRSSYYLDWSTYFSIKKASKIITVSNFVKREILNFYKTNKEKIKVIYNGYNNFLYRKIDNKGEFSEVLAKYGLEGPYFLYVGRIEKKKNIKILIEAFYEFKEKNKDRKEKLVLIGNRGFAYDEIAYLISELDLYQEVIMLGWVEEVDMPYIYNASKIFIFPSLHEGFGIPLLQAMACGIPIIASDIEVFKEIAQDVPIYFNRNSFLDLSNKMGELIKDEGRQQKMIISGLELVKNFSWEKCAKETLEEIKKI